MSRPYTPLFAAIRHSRKMALLSDAAERLYLRLLPQCDDWGRIDRDPVLVNAEAWPLLKRTPEETEQAILALEHAGLLETHQLNGQRWIQVPDWEEKAGGCGRKSHRRVSHFPEPTSASRAEPGIPGQSRADAGISGRSLRGRARAQSQKQIQTQKKNQNKRQSHTSAAVAAGAEPEPVPEGYAETVTCYFDAFEGATGEKPAFGPLEGRKVKELLAKAETAARACAVIRYAHSDDWRTSHGRVTLQGIVSDFNGLLVGARNAWKAGLNKGQLAFVQNKLAEANDVVEEDPYEKLLRASEAEQPKQLP